MSLENKIDFMVFVSATNANPNGDPLDGNRPRINYNGYGEISDVCIKRKIRNRMQQLGHKIFVQSEESADDGYPDLKSRAEGIISKEDRSDPVTYAIKACQEWLDVRSFGQVFAFKDNKKDKKGTGVSVGVRGPVSIHQAVSCSPVDIHSIQITKSVNGEPKKKDKAEAADDENDSSSGMSSDRMGMKHMVSFGLYVIKGSINVQLAKKTEFSEEDAEVIKKCLLTLFENDASSARPDGSMEVCRLYWWKHSCPDGQYSSAKVHRSVKAELKDGIEIPTSFEDYNIAETPLEGLMPEIYEIV